MDDKSEREKLREIVIETSLKYRGQIIHEVSRMERSLDFYIASYFCDTKEKVDEFANIILGANRISLDGKRKLFDILIKKQKPYFFTRYDTFNKDMNTVMYERNSFAHNMVSLRDDSISQHEIHIGLQKINANSRIEWYSPERVQSILVTIRRCKTLIFRQATARWRTLRSLDKE
jgi:hypothetical protein